MLGNIVKKVVKKVKAAVPKVVNAAKRKVKKVVKHVAKKVVPRVVKMVPKVVNAAKNKAKKVISKVVKSVPRVVNAAKAKINKTAKATAKKIKKVVKKTAQGVKQKVQKQLKEVSQKNERIVNKVKAAWQQTASGIKRGTVTIGAKGFNSSNSFKMLDFVLQARRAVVEEYPILNFPGSCLKDVVNVVKTGIVEGSQSAGKFIYDKKIPGVSDFVGALTDVRPENAESNIFTVAGAFTKGVVADGLGGTVEGIVDLAVDPVAAIEGVTKMLAYPEETLPAICEGVKEFWDKKVVNGSPEDRANIVGQAAFEIASWFVGAGEAKTAANAGKAADKLADTAKVVDKITDAAKAGDKLADTAKVADKITDVAKTADKAADLSKVTSKTKLLDKLPSTTALKNAGKNLAKNLDDMANKATKKLGKMADNAAGKATSQLKNLALKKNELVTKASDKLGDMAMEGGKKLGDTIDQMRHIMNQLTPQPALAMAGVGELDDIGRTGDKIQDIIKRTLKIDKSEAGSGVKISGAAKEEVIEDIKAVEEKVSKALDDVAEGAAKAEKAISRIDEIEVKFNYKSKYNEAEFARQLADQEAGMNKLTVDEYLKNRERYIAEGRAIEGNVAQQAARKEAQAQKIAELRKNGLSYSEAKKQAEEWLKSQAALHNPDQIAGGNPLNIGGMGDSKINSSIGSQWKYRIDEVDEQIIALADKMTEAERKSKYLNVKLKY